MSCIPAPCCKAALDEATKRWPKRNRGADGICASAAHKARDAKLGISSDHDIGNAFDITHDPAHGVDCGALVAEIIDRRDPRVKYVIWDRTMWRSYPKPGLPAWTAAPYTVPGGDPHTGHLHVSIQPEARNVLGPWWLAGIDQEDEMYDYRIVTIPAVNDRGTQIQGHDVDGHDLGPFSNDVVVTLKANDDSRPVKAIAQPYGYQGKLALSFIGLDGKAAPEGNVGVVMSRPPR